MLSSFFIKHTTASADNNLSEFSVSSNDTNSDPWTNGQNINSSQKKSKRTSKPIDVDAFDPAVVYNYIYHINARHPR